MSDEHAKHDEHGGEEHKGHSGGHGGGHGGHGGGGHAEGEHEGAPEWLISFADNVALMMGFFVILLAMNMGPKATPVQGGAPSEVAEFDAAEARQLDWVIGVRNAFNNPPSEANPGDAKLIRRMKERQAVGETTDPGPEGARKNVQAPRPTDWAKPTGVVFFSDGSDELGEDARTTLHQAAEALRGSRWIVQVRGHVSATEARRDKVGAMRLSFERALAAAGELVAAGLTWDQLRVVGCADADAATPAAGASAARRNNQRAEVVTTQEHLPADPFNKGR